MHKHIHRPALLAGSGILFALAVGYAIADEGPSTSQGDPDAGLSSEERMARHADASARSDATQRGKAAEFVRQGRNPADLERQPMAMDFSMLGGSLAEDVSLSDLVIEAVVTHTSIASVVDLSEATLTVLDPLRGEVRGPVRIVQSGGLEFHPATLTLKDKDEFALVEPEAVPLLLKGERVIVLLTRESWADKGGAPAYSVVPFRGVYWVEDDRIRTFEANPEHDTVSGTAVAEFKARIRATR